MTKRRTAPRKQGKSRRWRWLAALLVLSPGAWLGVEWWRLPDTNHLRTQAPALSALMRTRVMETLEAGRNPALQQSWVALDAIAPPLRQAVVRSEDARFWKHEGVDWVETRKVAARAWDERRLGRGASTITQQLAKNLYLSETRSLLRKAKEWELARRLERDLDKERILELYLNFAEWGDGVFGAQAASRHHFGKDAAVIEPHEAAVLAALLPAPRRWDPREPTEAFAQRARRIARLLTAGSAATEASVLARLDQLFGAAPAGPHAALPQENR